jgi:4-hydroxy-tetrahydrodipicolinate synthase
VDREFWRSRLRGGLIPAVPVPWSAEGQIHRQAQKDYVSYMAAQRQVGVAIWVHTGRGLFLTPEQREEIYHAWRQGLGSDKIIIAGAGALPDKTLVGDRQVERFESDTLAMAEQAKALGADALLVYPPVIYRGQDDEERLVVEHHQRLAELGMPLILFYLYEAAGGISYSLEVLDELTHLPQVVGIKMATLDSVMTFQEVALWLRERSPEIVLITGEDRFLDYSLMLGAESALIGMAAALTNPQADLISSYMDRDYNRFHDLAWKVTHLAMSTFFSPMEKYIVRMLGVLHLLGVIPRDAVHDPCGWELGDEDFAALKRMLRQIGAI